MAKMNQIDQKDQETLPPSPPRVNPGITCLWQLDGRSSVPFKKWL
jgi:lipopolysaccharide/colanic/teichoic acid biosynthesis glycosyltransferase